MYHMYRLVALVLVVLTTTLAAAPARQALAAANEFTVTLQDIGDQKAVYATVESSDIVPARARINGTLAGLSVDEGDAINAGDVIAVVGDEKLALQLAAIDARIRSLKAQKDQAGVELDRVKKLFASGTVAKARLDDALTAMDVITGELKGLQGDRSVIQRQMDEGKVVAPSAGRVLKVLVRDGSVIMAGEPVATIADENYVLRLRLPQRHARFLQEGDTVLIAPRGKDTVAPGAQMREGKVVLVYPEIENGQLIADVSAPGLGTYFVGERTPVLVTTGMRKGVLVPRDYLFTRTGLSFVRLKTDTGVTDIPVQTATTLSAAPDGMVEVLSGLSDGDVLVMP